MYTDIYLVILSSPGAAPVDITGDFLEKGANLLFFPLVGSM